MASKIIGRIKCPCCGFERAHVKVKEEEGKRPYIHCPNTLPDGRDCGLQLFAKNSAQEEWMRGAMTPISAPAPAPDPVKVDPSPEPAPAPEPRKKTFAENLL